MQLIMILTSKILVAKSLRVLQSIKWVVFEHAIVLLEGFVNLIHDIQAVAGTLEVSQL